jgi:hypothetical protein
MVADRRFQPSLWLERDEIQKSIRAPEDVITDSCSGLPRQERFESLFTICDPFSLGSGF